MSGRNEQGEETNILGFALLLTMEHLRIMTQML
jgi:hypothetical protein